MVPTAGPAAAPRAPLARLLRPLTRSYDLLDRIWERLMHGRALGLSLTLVFVVALVLVELNRRGLLPQPLAGRIELRHFAAVEAAFWLLLVFEVLALVFTLPHSVANSVGRQLELVSLIMLREAFLEFARLGEPVDIVHGYHTVAIVLLDLLAALVLFVLVGIYYRVQHHQPITPDEREQGSFIAAKKVVALCLFAAFLLLVGLYGVRFLQGRPTQGFFSDFFTILIFSDVLIVLISLAFTSGYHVVFRNSGFAAAAVLMRIALPAPELVRPALAVTAAGFALALTLAYNVFAPAIRGRA